MVQRTVISLLLVLVGLAAPAAPAAAVSGTPRPPVLMDTRFSGFDTAAHVRAHHPALAPLAVAISHWSGYYSVNPLLVTQAALAQAEQLALTGDSIRALAAALASLDGQRLDSAQLHQSLGSVLNLTPGITGRLIDEARTEMASAGLSVEPAASADTPPAMDLPFTRPQGWEFNGVHTWTGDNNGTPMSSIDLARTWSLRWGDDTSGDRVSAAHDGEVTVFSSCFVQVQHASGWGTRYYHLDGLTVTTGQQVRAGDDLGIYANELAQALCSGGHSNGPHVHFALIRDGQYFSLADKALSGYLIHPGLSSYDSDPEQMWLEKRGERFHAFRHLIAQEPGDNTIDYRYNGMWYSLDHAGHGMNIEITDIPGQGGSRKAVFVVIYTYDDAGDANFYVGNRDFERWRSDESLVIEMLQTAGGDFSNLAPIDFDDPLQVMPAGQLELRFEGCDSARVELRLDERVLGHAVSHALDLVKLIGVPQHVCEAASLPLP